MKYQSNSCCHCTTRLWKEMPHFPFVFALAALRFSFYRNMYKKYDIKPGEIKICKSLQLLHSIYMHDAAEAG